MRKTGLIVFIYAIIAFVACILFSNFIQRIPILIPGEEKSYIFMRGFLFFCKFLPALVFSAFLLGCAISYGKNSEKAKIKYSPLIMSLFRKTMISSIFLVLIVSLITEVFVPVFEQRQTRAKLKPVLYAEFMSLSHENFKKGNMQLAYEYSYNALLLNPKDTDALEVNEKAQAEINSLKMILDTNSEPAKTDFSLPSRKIKGETVNSLLKKAKEAAEKESWFDAHYYAYLAVGIGSEKDINLEDANRLASEAWNHLFSPSEMRETEEQKLFKKKREAYRTLISGDIIEAYYKFLEISEISDIAARDLDVSKFLEIASQRVEEQCFFIEDVENLRRFESYNNIYFAIPHEDGSHDVVYIRGITPVKNSGGMIQYLRELNIFTYSKEGRFMRSIYVPYAKMLSEKADTFDSETKEKFGIKDSFKSVPYLMLESISKTDRTNRISPVYEYDADYIKRNEPYLHSYYVLGLPMKDFNLLCDANSGSSKMSLVSLMRFMQRARDYGYSYEIFNANFIYRLTYPLLILICCMFMACMAWNYRLKEGQLFKFKWIFLMPAFTIILYFSMECLLYVYKLFNYTLVSMLGGGAIYVSAALLVLALIIVCFIFVSRRSD